MAALLSYCWLCVSSSTFHFASLTTDEFVQVCCELCLFFAFVVGPEDFYRGKLSQINLTISESTEGSPKKVWVRNSEDEDTGSDRYDHSNQLQKGSDRFYPKLVIACIYIAKEMIVPSLLWEWWYFVLFHKSETEDKALRRAPPPPPVMKSREVVFNTKSMEFQTEDSSSQVNHDGEVEISVHRNSTTTRNEASFDCNSTGGNEESFIEQLEPTEGNFWTHSSTIYLCWQMDDYLLLPNM